MLALAEQDIIQTYSFNFSPSTSVDPPKSVLKVNVPAELEGIAFIQVVIQKESEQLVSANICQSGTFDPSLVICFSIQQCFCLLNSVNSVIFPFQLFFTTFHNFTRDRSTYIKFMFIFVGRFCQEKFLMVMILCDYKSLFSPRPSEILLGKCHKTYL